MRQRSVAISCVCFLLVLSITEATFEVYVLVHAYDNPTHQSGQSANSNCCDNGCQDCDNRFTFYLQDCSFDGRICPGTNVAGLYYATELIDSNNDSLVFVPGEEISNGVPNPLLFTGESWAGSVQLIVEVDDVDDSSVDDRVDNILITVEASLGAPFSEPVVHSGEYGFGRLELSTRVQCSENYFGPNCATFCEDDPVRFTCDEDGNKVCRDGYRNSSMDCNECIPADGCSPVGGFCTVPGECICFDGFIGDRCTMARRDFVISTAVLGGVLVVFLLLAVLIAVAVAVNFCRRKRRKNIYGTTQPAPPRVAENPSSNSHDMWHHLMYLNQGAGSRESAVTTGSASTRQYDYVDHSIPEEEIQQPQVKKNPAYNYSTSRSLNSVPSHV